MIVFLIMIYYSAETGSMKVQTTPLSSMEKCEELVQGFRTALYSGKHEEERKNGTAFFCTR